MERHGLQRSPTAGWVIEREPGEPPADTTEDLSSAAAVGAPDGEAA